MFETFRSVSYLFFNNRLRWVTFFGSPGIYCRILQQACDQTIIVQKFTLIISKSPNHPEIAFSLSIDAEFLENPTVVFLSCLMFFKTKL